MGQNNNTTKLMILFMIGMILLVSFNGCIDYYEYATGGQSTENSPSQKQNNDLSSVSIACWNLQIFGLSKAANESLLAYYADCMDEYDITIIQEIRDASGKAIEKLAFYLPTYDYVISSRAGQTISKEQYAIFYNQRINLLSTQDYTTTYQTQMNRPPYQITFTVNNWTCSLYTIHTDPDTVPEELSILENILRHETKDTILIGDLNADGSYYDENHISHFTDWHWIIPNNADTTVSASDNTYDRIIVNNNAFDNVIDYEIMDNVTKKQSDHYLIFGIFNSTVP